MNISGIMSKEIVFLGLSATTRDEVLHAMIEGVANAGYLKDKEKYSTAVHGREEKGTTGIGFGVAIPHGKSDGVGEPCVAFARVANPVDWDSFDGKPVRNVFLIAVPEEAAGNEHLKILIAISKKLMHEDFRQQLDQVDSPEALFKLLESIEA